MSSFSSFSSSTMLTIANVHLLLTVRGFHTSHRICRPRWFRRLCECLCFWSQPHNVPDRPGLFRTVWHVLPVHQGTGESYIVPYIQLYHLACCSCSLPRSCTFATAIYWRSHLGVLVWCSHRYVSALGSHFQTRYLHGLLIVPLRSLWRKHL